MIFLIVGLSLLAYGFGQFQTAIKFGIDHREHLIPHTKYNYTSYATVYTLKTKEDASQPLDLVTHADFRALKLLYAQANRSLPVYLRHNDDTVELFESKANWKAWMHRIGLGKYVPITYDVDKTDLINYPVVLKTNEHNGRGVYVAENEHELHSMIKVITHKENATHALNFTIEEALTGLGLSEAVSFGSAYMGKVVSLRCMVRNFELDKAVHSAKHGHEKHHKASGNATVFIKGKTLNYESQDYIPCSKELVNITQFMFAHLPPYTGAFCSDIKMDSRGQFKIMETNARFCYSMRTVEAVFLSTYVPLSFAVQEHLPVHSRAAWVNASHLAQFYALEQDVLRSGGGIFNGTLISVEKFNATLRVHGPKYSADTTPTTDASSKETAIHKIAV